jgi:hypothetical protein
VRAQRIAVFEHGSLDHAQNCCPRPVPLHVTEAPGPRSENRSQFWATVLPETQPQMMPPARSTGTSDTRTVQPSMPADPIPVEPSAFPVRPRVALSSQVSPLRPSGPSMSEILPSAHAVQYPVPDYQFTLPAGPPAHFEITPVETPAPTPTRRRPRRRPSTRRFICDLCLQTFERRGHRDSHYEAVHQGIQKHQCYFIKCLKRFGHRSSLNRHLRSVHSIQNTSPGAGPSDGTYAASVQGASDGDAQLSGENEQEDDSYEDEYGDDSPLPGSSDTAFRHGNT